MTRIPLAIVLIGCMSAASGGCAVLKPKPAPQKDFLTVIENLPAGPPLPASMFFRPAEESMRFDIVKGDGVGGVVTINRTETNRFGAKWADEEPGVRTEFFSVDKDGEVFLTAAIDYDDNAISLFDPPLTAVHPLLRTGRPQSQEVAIRVVDLRNPQRQRASGKATQTIEHLGRRRVRTPNAEFVADCVSIRLVARLGLARATQETTFYIMEDLGIVAAEHEEQVNALGIYNRTHRRTLVRREILPIESAAAVGR